MGEIEEGLERAMRTRPIPQSTAARVRFLVKVHRGSTKAVAQELGVSQRTVQRWLQGTRVTPKPPAAKAIEDAVKATWQPRIRKRARRSAETRGFQLSGRARFGFASSAGSTDDPRERTVSQWLPGDIAQRLFQARDAGADEREQAGIIAQGLQETYFQQAGNRAASLQVAFDDISYLDFGID
ncbi:hypothetical protein GCM10010495_69660 [Kitasatospora herbaricolor]|uniref:telomere-protecting terminal protein Tpg n=1 Tax=Kitasatospora herbaricolor TaxID=68217 RepID=UPI0017497627|nr:helix-turn-helix transcriptional regulator [Kitasatospora herbaricolor]MDQ0313319.1 transcriptional regulator with XRE-family HTH domain [Kitasatospora herbaricolor]GGV42072.1 hypothetical protein GCM10010495_69660 [Kitasatospora herbaricolor]